MLQIAVNNAPTTSTASSTSASVGVSSSALDADPYRGGTVSGRQRPIPSPAYVSPLSLPPLLFAGPNMTAPHPVRTDLAQLIEEGKALLAQQREAMGRARGILASLDKHAALPVLQRLREQDEAIEKLEQRISGKGRVYLPQGFCFRERDGELYCSYGKVSALHDDAISAILRKVPVDELRARVESDLATQLAGYLRRRPASASETDGGGVS